MSSNTAKAYANGVSQTRLILGSTPFVNAGMALSDARDAWMHGQYGDVAEIAGGLAGGAAIGAGVARYGGYGVTLTDIGATGIRASQAGSIGLKIVVPEATIEGPFNSIVPGGGLAAHEMAGGHLLQKHVGKTIDELVARFWKEPEISGSSSFYDRATAEKAVSNVLDINSDKISQWLIGTSNRLVVKSLLPKKTGIFFAPSMRTAINVHGARVVIERDPSMPNGYKILAGYPIQP